MLKDADFAAGRGYQRAGLQVEVAIQSSLNT
jgi:hypothetical protein